jgi:hypothetical protein
MGKMGTVNQGVILHHWRSFLLSGVLLGGSFCASAHAQRSIEVFSLFDKLRGMWVGQLVGNATGRATEGLYSSSTPNPDPCVPWQLKQIWDADDDTDIEYLALHTLETYGFDCNSVEIAGQWLEHVTDANLYVANLQAWRLLGDGLVPPETGSRTYNEHWYSIDAQIGTEVLGAVSPGLPQTAIDLAGRFGRVSNSGFAVHAAQFYAALYANAFFEPNVVNLVAAGLAALPAGSRTEAVITDVLHWYLEDAADGVLDWRTTRGKLYDKYQGPDSSGRYYNWVESTINVGATVLALLYGRGDFKQTVQIAVLAGWDCDCNAATAGGLSGIIHGFTRLPHDLTDPAVCGNTYVNVARPGLPDPTAPLPQSELITTVAIRMFLLAGENIVRSGGSYRSNSRERVYSVPACGPVVPDPEQPDPLGPAGLVGQALAAGITVTPTASVERLNRNHDRSNLYSILDGVTDNSHNGHKAYYTLVSDPAARPEKDWYQLTFSEPVCFEKVIFYEGDVLWKKLNRYYREDEPLGGFFEDLTVQILRDGEYVEPPDLQMAPPLDRFQMYQTITFRFAPTVGRAIRILGTPGGSQHFTTILELEGEGRLLPSP